MRKIKCTEASHNTQEDSTVIADENLYLYKRTQKTPVLITYEATKFTKSINATLSPL